MLSRFLKWFSLTRLTKRTDSHRCDAFGGTVSDGTYKSVRDDLGAPCSCTVVTGGVAMSLDKLSLTESLLIARPYKSILHARLLPQPLRRSVIGKAT